MALPPKPKIADTPIMTPPPWIKSKLTKKNVSALTTMMRMYGIVAGHNWHKQDYVKALYDYGRQFQHQAEENDDAQAEENDGREEDEKKNDRRPDVFIAGRVAEEPPPNPIMRGLVDENQLLNDMSDDAVDAAASDIVGLGGGVVVEEDEDSVEPMSEIKKWCMEVGISDEISDSLEAMGFAKVCYVTLVSKQELQEKCGLSFAESIKVDKIFQDYRNGAQGGNGGGGDGGAQGGAQGGGSVVNWKFARVNGVAKRYWCGAAATAADKRKFRDDVLNIVMVDAASTNASAARLAVDKFSKKLSTSAAKIRFEYDFANDAYPQNPTDVTWHAAHDLHNIGVIAISDEEYKKNGRGGKPNWTRRQAQVVRRMGQWQRGPTSPIGTVYGRASLCQVACVCRKHWRFVELSSVEFIANWVERS